MHSQGLNAVVPRNVALLHIVFGLEVDIGVASKTFRQCIHQRGCCLIVRETGKEEEKEKEAGVQNLVKWMIMMFVG